MINWFQSYFLVQALPSCSMVFAQIDTHELSKKIGVAAIIALIVAIILLYKFGKPKKE